MSGPAPLASYIAALVPLVGGATECTGKGPQQEAFAAAIDAHGWPADIAGVLAIYRAAAASMNAGDLPDISAEAVARDAVWFASMDRLRDAPVRSIADARAKLAYLREDMGKHDGNEDWSGALDTVVDWLAEVAPETTLRVLERSAGGKI